MLARNVLAKLKKLYGLQVFPLAGLVVMTGGAAQFHWLHCRVNQCYANVCFPCIEQLVNVSKLLPKMLQTAGCIQVHTELVFGEKSQ